MNPPAVMYKQELCLFALRGRLYRVQHDASVGYLTLASPQPRASNATQETGPKRDQHLKRFHFTPNRLGNWTFVRTKHFHLCRVPDRPCKLARVSFAHYFIYLSAGQHRQTFFSASRQYAAAKGRFVP